jgi:ArsR family transcriptional regulator
MKVVCARARLALHAGRLAEKKLTHIENESILIFEYGDNDAMNVAHKHKAEILKALGHPIRFCIVEGLVSGGQNVATMVECIGVPQPTVSQHLNILKAAGIIEGERVGNQVHYSVCSAEARKIVHALR